MAPPKRPWFRFYVEAVHDRKLRRLKPEVRWLFVACLAAARQSPVPGTLLITEDHPMDDRDLADFAGMDIRTVRSGLRSLIEVGVIFEGSPTDLLPKSLTVAAWKSRQYESDDVTARTSKHRVTRRNGSDATPNGTTKERSKNGDATPDGTPPETETENRYRTSSSTSAEPPADDRLDDDHPATIAARTLAQTDLEQREHDKGSVGDRDRWLHVATRRRAREIDTWLNTIGYPLLDPARIVEHFQRKAAPEVTRVCFDETPEQQLARLVLQHDLVDDPRDRDAIAEQIHDLERRLASTDR